MHNTCRVSQKYSDLLHLHSPDRSVCGNICYVKSVNFSKNKLIWTNMATAKNLNGVLLSWCAALVDPQAVQDKGLVFFSV